MPVKHELRSPHDANAPIHANQYWNDTGVRLTAGVQYRFTVVPGEGEAFQDASFKAATIDGEDWKSLPHKAAELVHGKRVDEAQQRMGIAERRREFTLVLRRSVVNTGACLTV